MVYRPNTQDVVITGGVSARGNLSDCWVFSLLELSWRHEPGAVTDPRSRHRSFFWGSRIALICGANKKSPASTLVVIDAHQSQDWSESEVREYGNRPLGVCSFAIASIGPTTLLLYGGADPASGNSYATSYILELQGGNIQRMRRPSVKYIAPCVVLTGRSVKEKAIVPPEVENEVAGAMTFWDFLNEVAQPEPAVEKAPTESEPVQEIEKPFLDFSAQFNIESLAPVAQTAARESVARLWALKKENDILSRDVARKEAQLTAVNFPGKEPVMLKIKTQEKVAVMKMPGDVKVEDVERAAAQVVGQDVAVAVQRAEKAFVPLNDENLRLALVEMAKNGEKVLIVRTCVEMTA
jgi:hypothetical protein